MTQAPDRHEPEDDDLGAGLTEAQWIAVKMLCEGKSFDEVANALGLGSRQTPWRWSKMPAFDRAKRQYRRELFQGGVDRFWHLQSLAMDVAEESLREGDPRMATDILKLGAAGFRSIVEIDGVNEQAEEENHNRRRTPTTARDSSAPHQGSKGEEIADTSTCRTCRKVLKSPRGLAQHMRLSHP